MFGGIEAGGTRIVCAVGVDPQTIVRTASFAARAPDATMRDVVAFFRDGADGGVAALGIGSFGPLVLDPASAEYGAIARTPKPGWSGFNLRRVLADALGCPVAIDTDVNAAGLAEAACGAGEGVGTVVYVTVGTGIGGGVIVNGVPLHGLTHPEMGHLRLRRHRLDGVFAGVCPFHGDCIEGLASGSAIVARTGRALAELPDTDDVWEIVADYLGQLCAAVCLMVSPELIILGGGVMASNPVLFAAIRQATMQWIAGYIVSERLGAGIDRFIVPPALGTRSAIVGALMMAARLEA